MGPRSILDSRSQSRDARAMTQARRLAAIMVIDVVGHSRLMGQGEAGIARAVCPMNGIGQMVVRKLTHAIPTAEPTKCDHEL
jgi:hypothetical protein